ncbi:MAG TPA: amidase family protein, partial [Acidimicrobiia bacterium]|nr:amidase family protein [Acidimicrobiia bacterium]
MTVERSTIDDAYRRIAQVDDPAIVVSMLDRADAIERHGALGGMPVLVKDNVALRGVPTAAACPAYATEPAVASATIVSSLEAAGATVIGTTNMDQFATGLVGTRSPHGTPRNPLAPGYIPG